MSNRAGRRMRATAAMASPFVPLPSPNNPGTLPLLNALNMPRTGPLVHPVALNNKQQQKEMNGSTVAQQGPAEEGQNQEDSPAPQKSPYKQHGSVVEYYSSRGYKSADGSQPAVRRTVRRYQDSTGRETFSDERSLGEKKHRLERDNKERMERPGAVGPGSVKRVETDFGDDGDYTEERFEEDWKKRQEESRRAAGGGFFFGPRLRLAEGDHPNKKPEEAQGPEKPETEADDEVLAAGEEEQQMATAQQSEAETTEEATRETERAEENPYLTAAAEAAEKEAKQDENHAEDDEMLTEQKKEKKENAGEEKKEGRTATELFERCASGVCHVTPLTHEARLFGRQLSLFPESFSSLFDGFDAPSSIGAGNGFAWDEEHVVTNLHVLRRRQRALVTLSDGRTTCEARLLGAQPDLDLAVLKLEQKTKTDNQEEEEPTTKLCPLPLGSSEGLEVGQRVFAIGSGRSLFGPDQLTLTSGTLSGLKRQVRGLLEGGRPLRGLLQADFPGLGSHPGIYSGGLLLDQEGRLLGVNAKVVASLGRRRGATGFAIPVDRVARAVRELLAHGHTIRPWLGVRVVASSAELTGTPSTSPFGFLRDRHQSLFEQFGHLRFRGLPSQEEKEDSWAVLVVGVEEKSPAAEANLRPMTRNTRTGRICPGDAILAVDGQELRRPEDLVDAVEEREVGDKLTLRVLRADQEEPEEVSVELAARPHPESMLSPETDDNTAAAAPRSNL